ncbi:hypothetical protein V1478_011417 [Vespula squamosa]|uniref:Uncharacterized protein n=1 Tax=Vespula squamosa TaxID=30214 RepID=A0ABD2AEE3_VESSQ
MDRVPPYKKVEKTKRKPDARTKVKERWKQKRTKIKRGVLWQGSYQL